VPVGGVSNLISAAAVLRLAESGKLQLDDRIRGLLRANGDGPFSEALAQTVAQSSGQSYEAYVQSAVLTPAGISGMRFGPPGGWSASGSDLLRLVNALDGRRP